MKKDLKLKVGDKCYIGREEFTCIFIDDTTMPFFKLKGKNNQPFWVFPDGTLTTDTPQVISMRPYDLPEMVYPMQEEENQPEKKGNCITLNGSAKANGIRIEDWRKTTSLFVDEEFLLKHGTHQLEIGKLYYFWDDNDLGSFYSRLEYIDSSGTYRFKSQSGDYQYCSPTPPELPIK